jgi:hypothetical protein
VNQYDVGDLVRVTGTFTDAAGTAIDPTTVAFKVKKPDRSITTYTYGTDMQLVKESTGNYRVDISADVKGKYKYRWYSTGNGQAAGESEFEVIKSSF